MYNISHVVAIAKLKDYNDVQAAYGTNDVCSLYVDSIYMCMVTKYPVAQKFHHHHYYC